MNHLGNDLRNDLRGARNWSVAEIPPQYGKLAVVTGANSGIGWHTARELARAGCEVILAARTREKGRDAVERIRQELPLVKVRAEALDLASLKSVRAFAERVGATEKLDLLINNAGVMKVPRRELTEDGFERQLGTNFLGHFALTALLLPALLRAQAPRVTTIASVAAKMGMRRIDFDDLQGERRYGPWTAYCQSKLADLMFALELSRRCEASGIPLLSNAAHPGIAVTNLQTAGSGKPPGVMQRAVTRMIAQDAFHGALPTLRAASDAAATGGSYYGPDGRFQWTGDPVAIPIPKIARDTAAAKGLWDVAENLTGTTFGQQGTAPVDILRR